MAIIFHKVRKGWSELQGDSLASLHWSAERDTRLFDVHLKWRSRHSVFPYECCAESLCMWFGMRWIYKFKI